MFEFEEALQIGMALGRSMGGIIPQDGPGHASSEEGEVGARLPGFPEEAGGGEVRPSAEEGDVGGQGIGDQLGDGERLESGEVRAQTLAPAFGTR